MSKVYVATYGSLRKGMENERVNVRAGAEYVGRGKTLVNANLYRYGNAYFPSVSLAHDSNNLPVIVDVWVTDQAGLEGPYDCLEGYPDFYNRTQVDIGMDDGNIIKAWIYHIDEEMNELIDSGDWCLHNRPGYYDDSTD